MRSNLSKLTRCLNRLNRNTKTDGIRLTNLAVILTLVILFAAQSIQGFGFQQGHAQTEAQSWTEPVNLSNSGAASQPRILAGPGEILQVFWIDRFDGLVTTIFDGKEWSTPQSAPIFSDSTVSAYLTQMPYLIADQSGWLHAFWQSANPRPLTSGQNFIANSIYHSKMPAGGTSWTTPELLAEDALTYSVYAPVDGGLNLAYIRRIQADGAPAGVYARRLPSGPSSWEPSVNVYASIYYRLLTPGSANVAIADDSSGNLFVIWNDPNQNLTLAAQSDDNGRSWSEQTIYSNQRRGDPTPNSLRLTAMPGQVLSIWQTLGLNNCSLYQQEWISTTAGEIQNTAAPTPIATAIETPEVTPTVAAGDESGAPAEENSSLPGWSNPVRIFPSLDNCPTGDSLWPEIDQQQIYWLWGQGASSLSLSAWDNERQQWSIPISETFSFTNPTSAGVIILGDLHATIANNRLDVVGFDPAGEIWAIRSENPITDFIYAPQPAWDSAQPVTSSDQSVGEYSLAMEQSGRTHLVFTQLPNSAVNQQSTLGASIIYTYTTDSASALGNSNLTSQDQLQNNQVEIFPGNPVELIRHPALLADDGANFLHLVWSGQEQGNILYSRAPLDKADIPGEWFPIQTLSGASMASWPQIGMEANGRLYVLYSIALNEDRGIYLTSSDDHGETWSIAEQIFDAAAAGLQGVERPTLYVEPTGILHAAWVETSPAGNGISQGIFYTSSADSGKTWSDPIVLAGEGNDWPKLAAAESQLHLIYVQSGQLWERMLPIDEPQTSSDSPGNRTNRWTTAIRLPGWSEISLPYGLASDGSVKNGNLHLTGNNSQNGTITYSTWRNGSWSSPESFSPDNIISLAPVSGLGVQAATKPDGGNLAIAWLSSIQNGPENTGAELPGLFFTTRQIDEVELPAAPTAKPTATSTPPPAPTPTLFLPTPTPDLNLVPPPNSTAQGPLIISAIIVGIFFAGFFVWRLLRSRRK